MIMEAWLLIGVVAFLGLALLIFVPDRAETNTMMTVVAAITFVLWTVWSYGALGVDVHSGGTVETVSMPALAILGGGFATLSFIFLLTGPFGMLQRWQSGDPRKV